MTIMLQSQPILSDTGLFTFFQDAQYELTRMIERRDADISPLKFASKYFMYTGWQVKPFSIYLRGNHSGQLIVSNIEGQQETDNDMSGTERQGRMPLILEALEDVSNGPVRFESVINPYLKNWLQKRGYEMDGLGNMEGKNGRR